MEDLVALETRQAVTKSQIINAETGFAASCD